MPLAVIIPVRNARHDLPAQLDALADASQGHPDTWMLIVADNGSTDDTVPQVHAWAAGHRRRVEVVDAGAQPGINRARNAGARAAVAAGADALAFCDADDEVGEGWVPAMAAAAHRWDVWGGALDRCRFTPPAAMRPGMERSRALTPWPGFLPFASGANLGVRAAVWASVGGFDESYAGGGDDVDFCWRTQLAGHTIGFVPEAVVHYRERDGLRATARQFRRYGRQDPHLFRDHAEAGMPPSGVARSLPAWGHLTVLAPRYLRTAAGRAQWVRSVARRVGRIEGSIRERTLYL